MSAGDSLGPQFEFQKAEPRAMGGNRNHVLMAKLGDDLAGHIEWSHKTGEIRDLHVEPEYRRQGIATSLWQQAQVHAEQTRGVKPPRHSADRTNDGEAWARTISPRLPKRQDRSEW